MPHGVITMGESVPPLPLVSDWRLAWRGRDDSPPVKFVFDVVGTTFPDIIAASTLETIGKRPMDWFLLLLLLLLT